MRFMLQKQGCVASLAACVFCHTPSAYAGGLQVAPASIQMPINNNATGIWLSNTNSSPLTAQIRVFKWSQADGEDLMSSTSQLTISPPVVEIPAGGKQLVRIIRTGAAPAIGTETAYRLIVDELPAEVPEALRPPTPTPSRRSFGMNFLMRYSVPVFIGDATDDSIKDIGSQLEWSAHKDDSTGQWIVRVTNHASVRAQLADLSAVTTEGQTRPLISGMLGYVLPGSTRQWKLAATPRTQALKGFQAQINSDTQMIKLQP